MALPSNLPDLGPLARLADQRLMPLGQGYVAERHPLLPSLVLVWAPCGCLWVGDNQDNFITPCGRVECDFLWTDAAEALQQLRLAEKALEAPSEALPEASDAPQKA